MHTQVSSCSSQIHTIHIQPNGLFADLRIVAMLFFLGCIFASTKQATISLAPTGCLAGFILPHRAVTLWTFLHPSILAHPLSHSDAATFVSMRHSCDIIIPWRESATHLAWDGHQASLSGLSIPAKLIPLNARKVCACESGKCKE